MSATDTMALTQRQLIETIQEKGDLVPRNQVGEHTVVACQSDIR